MCSFLLFIKKKSEPWGIGPFGTPNPHVSKGINALTEPKKKKEQQQKTQT